MSRYIMVEVKCEWCSKKFMARKTRVMKGQSRFCSLKHYHEWIREHPSRQNMGKENAKRYIMAGEYKVQWIDPETRKAKNMSWAKYEWEKRHGPVPDGHKMGYKDGNPLTDSVSNICLVSPEEYSKKVSALKKGIPKSEEHKRKLSIAHTGKVLSDEHKQHIGLAVKKMWKDGVFDSPETRAAYSKWGKINNLGRKPSDESRKKMSESGKRRWTVENVRDQLIDSFKKRWVKQEEKEKLSLSMKKRHAEHPEMREKTSKALKGRKVTDEHRQHLSDALRGKYTGKENPAYKNGNGSKPYPPEFSTWNKKKIRRRDNYECQSCGENLFGSYRGHVHHIDGNKENCDPVNLLLLCITCHNAVHGRNHVINDAIKYLRSRLPDS